MELTILIAALEREVERRRTVEEAATKLAQTLGVEAHEQGLQAIEKTVRDMSADRLTAGRRFRSITPIPVSESDPENGAGETSPSQSA
jgi:hypothetical protein